MITPLLMVLALALPQEETVIPVERGMRLSVENFRGEVTVEVWDRDEVRVRADLDDRQALDATRSGATVRVRTRAINGGPGEAEFDITIPRWMAIQVSGNQVDVRIEGTEGEIEVETVGGDVTVDGGRDLIAVRSIQGEVMIRNAQGRVEALSVNEDIELDNVSGELYVETTNGDVTLTGIQSARARATTVNGDITYSGPIMDDGRYAFSTHNGDLDVSVGEEANVTVAVSTFHGEFESDFPVRLTGTTRDREFNFTLGSGRAQLELESFNGEIRLRRGR